MRKLTASVALFAAAAFLIAGSTVFAQDQNLRYEPMSLDKPFEMPFKAIDSHTHFSIGTADSMAAHMEEWGLEKIVVLALPNDNIDTVMAEFGKYPDKFAVLYPPRFDKVNEKGFKKDLEKQIRHAHDVGCAGIKLYKDFSVYVKDKDGKNIPIDSPLYDPMWKTAGELDMPILVHVGDPERFWIPIDDRSNFIETEDWAFYGKGVPFREELVRELENVIKKYPETTFVGAHVGNRAEEPMIVSYLLGKYPNYYVDISARYGELSKNMRATRWLLMQHPDKVLFGTDWGIWSPDGFYDGWIHDAKKFYSRAERILFTRDHKIPTPFDGNEGPILVATHRWACDGWEIPEDVLHQVMVETPEKVFFKHQK